MAVTRLELEKLERVVQETASAVHELAPIVRSNAESIRLLGSKTDYISTSLARHTEPKGISTATLLAGVSSVIGFGGLLLSIVVAVGGLAIYPMQKRSESLEQHLEEFGRHYIDHILNDKSSGVEERVRSIEREVFKEATR